MKGRLPPEANFRRKHSLPLGDISACLKQLQFGGTGNKKLSYFMDAKLACPYSHIFIYYNVVLFSKLLTRITILCRYIEKLLTNHLLLPGSAMLNALIRLLI